MVKSIINAFSYRVVGPYLSLTSFYKIFVKTLKEWKNTTCECSLLCKILKNFIHRWTQCRWAPSPLKLFGQAIHTKNTFCFQEFVSFWALCPCPRDHEAKSRLKSKFQSLKKWSLTFNTTLKTSNKVLGCSPPPSPPLWELYTKNLRLSNDI